jgi:hypothetical protein
LKLRLVLKTKTKKGKIVTIKIGFINFINLTLKQDNPVTISFEKISKSGEKEESKISGDFKFQSKSTADLALLEEEIQEEERKRKKQKHKKK